MTREEAIDIIRQYECCNEHIEACEMAIEALKFAKHFDLLKEFQSLQEVVQCKDCKWYGHLGCAIRIVDDSDKPHDNDFCSFGERREE